MPGQSILLWLRRAQRFELTKASFVWVIEDDAVYTGSLQAFLASYAPEAADLITVFCTFENGQHEGCTDASGRRQPLPLESRPGTLPLRKDAIVHHWEHVVRFSTRLLGKLELEIDLGRARHGEDFASTFCANQTWCTTQDLRNTRSASLFVGPRKLRGEWLPQLLSRKPISARKAKNVIGSRSCGGGWHMTWNPLGRWYHSADDAICPMLEQWSGSPLQIDGKGMLQSRIKMECAHEDPHHAGMRSSAEQQQSAFLGEAADTHPQYRAGKGLRIPSLLQSALGPIRSDIKPFWASCNAHCCRVSELSKKASADWCCLAGPYIDE